MGGGVTAVGRGAVTGGVAVGTTGTSVRTGAGAGASSFWTTAGDGDASRSWSCGLFDSVSRTQSSRALNASAWRPRSRRLGPSDRER